MSGRIPSRGSDQFNLRLPDGMRDRIAEAAKDNGRSMNAEIVQRLEWSFAAPQVARGGGGDIGPATADEFASMLVAFSDQATATVNKLRKELDELRAARGA